MTLKLEAKSRLELTAMAGFTGKSTGIEGVVIWLNPGDGGKHGPRIKVSNVRGKARFDAKDCFSVSVPRDPQAAPAVVAGICELPAKDLQKVLAFVSHNTPELLKLWRAEALPDEVEFTKV